MPAWLGWLITFNFVNVAWVFFRATTLDGALRLLPGRFMVIEQAMAVPRGRALARDWLAGFVENVKASGFVAEALRRHGIQGAEVAPAA